MKLQEDYLESKFCIVRQKHVLIFVDLPTEDIA